MAAEYDFVVYEPGLKSLVADLQVHLWSRRVATNLRYLDWKFEHNPYLDDPLLYLAIHEGRAVGMRGIFGALWEENGRRFQIPCASDLVVAPEHRDRGLHSRIMELAFQDLARRGFEYVFNLSAGHLTYLGSRAMGWRGIGSVAPAERESPDPSILRRIRRQTGPMLGRPFLLFDSRTPHQRKSPIRVSRYPDPPAMASLVTRLGSDGRIRHVRDETYFAWRYRNPLCRYRFLFWREADLEGYLVLSCRPRMKVVSIVDHEATDVEVFSALLQAAVSLGTFDRLHIWTRSLSPPELARLDALGFKPHEQPPGITHFRRTVLVRPVDLQNHGSEWTLAGRRLLEPASWDLRMIYADDY
jgi:GNAT superfamily N-acetyltransferase